MSELKSELDGNNQPALAAEIPRLTSELAAQAAVRAQQMLRRQCSQEDNKAQQQQQQVMNLPPRPHNKAVPAIPARANDRAPPPEIPPKRHSLKCLPDGLPVVPPSRQPPPLPKKPVSAQNSAQNSPLAVHKFKEKPPLPPEKPEMRRNSNPFNVSPPQTAFLETATSGARSSVPSPAPTRAADAPKKPNHLGALGISASATALSPSEDFGSADALRGIESGLRNMERAMQEQLNLRSMEAAAAAAAAAQNNNYELNRAPQARLLMRSGIYDRNHSLDESREAILARHCSATRQSFEELQLRAQQLQKQQQLQANGAPGAGASPTHAVEYPPRLPNIEHHMRSLDRNLPLELQYSRHRHVMPAPMPPAQQPQQTPTQQTRQQRQQQASHQQQQQQQQSETDLPPVSPIPLSADLREQIRQQLLGVAPPMNVVHNTGSTPGSAAAAALLQHQAQSRAVAAAQVVRSALLANAQISREEMRMRRRSSHDETVTAGAQFTAAPGTTLKNVFELFF